MKEALRYLQNANNYKEKNVITVKTSIYKKQVVHEIQGIPEEYLPNLVQIIRLFRESVALKPSVDSFRQGWKEAQTGVTQPVSGLWDGIDAE